MKYCARPLHSYGYWRLKCIGLYGLYGLQMIANLMLFRSTTNRKLLAFQRIRRLTVIYGVSYAQTYLWSDYVSMPACTMRAQLLVTSKPDEDSLYSLYYIALMLLNGIAEQLVSRIISEAPTLSLSLSVLSVCMSLYALPILELVFLNKLLN